jgi:hypothetical protein
MRIARSNAIRQEKNRPCVYFLRCGNFVKIGKTTYGSLNNRISALQTGNPDPMILIGLIPDKTYTTSKSSCALEYDLHNRFSHLRKTGEWFEWSHEIQDFLREAA